MTDGPEVDTTEIFGVPISVCDECEVPFVDHNENRSHCDDCQERRADSLRVDLEALADKWAWDEDGIICNEAFARDQCAQELRSLLEDHQ